MTTATISPTKKPRYRLLTGKHTELRTGLPPIMYSPGSIIETDDDLCMFNCQGALPKFERVDDGHPLASATTWNPEVESLDDFTARMRTMDISATTSSQESASGRLGEAGAPPSSDLSSAMRDMTVDQLRTLAEEEEVEIPAGLTDKNKVIDIILRGVKG